MVNLDYIKDYIQNLNYKNFMVILYGYIIFFILLLMFLLYRHYNAITDLMQKTKVLNNARKDIQLILTQYDTIKSKTNEVDALLAKDKNFYIQKYYQDTIASLSIKNQSSSNLVSQNWPNGYIEESLQINLSLITMQQLCEFLQALQTNARIFVKNLDIVKANVDKKINVNMAIATIKQVAEKTTTTR